MKFLSSEGCVINTSSRGCGSEMKNEESNFQITLKWFCDMLVFIALVFLSCLSLSGWVHAAKTKKCFGCSEARNEPQQSFQNPQKNIHWEIIRVDFYHRDNGDVVCLSEITLSVKDTSSCFLCACIFHSWTLRESIQLHRLSFQLFQCTCDPLIRGFIKGFIQTTTNTCL